MRIDVNLQQEVLDMCEAITWICNGIPVFVFAFSILFVIYIAVSREKNV